MYKENNVKTIELKDLNENLEKKVNERTHELKDANYELSILNARLEKEKFRSELELEMASIVQRKFFPQPIKHFKGSHFSAIAASSPKEYTSPLRSH